MTFKPLLLAATALALTAYPMASLAQQHHGGGGGGGGHGGGGGAPHGGGGGGMHMGGGGGMPRGGGAMHVGGGGGGFRGGGGGAAHTRGGGGGASFHARTGGASSHTRTGGATTHTRTAGASVRTRTGGTRTGATSLARSGRTGGVGAASRAVGGRAPVRQSAAVHTQLRNSWASNRSVVASHAVWRGNRNWWRGNAHFNGYTGARNGFFFAPGFGYYAVPGIYWGHSWGIGAFLPLFFLTYTLTDWADYGCPPPPPGCAWVWVGPNLLLVDIADGYVVDEYYNVF